jgi:GAF domain-containing protein
LKDKPIGDAKDGLDGSVEVNRLYAVLSKVNEAMVRIRQPQALYEAACRIAVEDGGFLLAWIGFVEPGSDYILPLAKSGRDDGYLDSVRVSLSADVPEGRGPTGLALREGRAFINNDTENNPIMRPWRDEQLKRGFRSSASFPLTSEGKTVGVITLYAGEPGYFNSEEVRLLGCLADDFSLALEVGELQRQRDRSLLAIDAARRELEERVVEVSAEYEDLLEERSRRAIYAEALNRINLGIHSSLDVDWIMDRAIRDVAKALQVDAVAVQARGEDDWSFPYSCGLSEDLGSRHMSDDEVPVAVEVSRSREPILVSDVTQDPRVNIRTMGEFGITALMAVPLIVGGEVFGVLVVDRFSEPVTFSDEQLEFLTNVAAALGVAVDNARLHETETRAQQAAKRELETASILLQAASELNRWTDLQSLLDALVGIVLPLIPGGRVNIGIAAEDRSSMTMAAGGGVRPYPVGRVVPWDQLTSGARGALESGTTSIIDFEQLAEGGIANEYGSRRALFVALKFGHRIIGQIGLDVADQRYDFTAREIALVEGIASQAAVAIENARLFEEQERRAERMAVLKELAEIGATAFSVTDVADRLAEAVIRLLGASNAVVAIPRGDRLEPVALIGYPPDFAEKLNPLPEDSLAAQAFRSGERRFVENSDTSEVSEFTRTASRALGFGSFAALPLMVAQTPVGVVGFVWTEIRRFDPAEESFLSSVVAEAALGIRNAQLFEAERESARLSEALNGVNRAVHSTLEIDEVMQHALEAGVEALGCDSGAIEMSEAGEWVVRYQTGFSPQDVGIRLTEAQAPGATRAARDGAPFQIELMPDDPLTNVGFVEAYGLKSVLAVPLFTRGVVTGCALFYTSKDVRRFTDSEIDFGRKLGAVVSLGLENARLYSVERNTAQTLQRALLTLPESLRGIDFAPSYRSATESMLVGGDFYDIFELDDDRVGITIGDISGKGLRAAVLTSLVKDTIRAHANERSKTPAHILTLTNDLVYRATPTESFATVFFAILDRRDGRLSFANAGHTTALIMKRDGTTAKLPVSDPILGAFADVEFGETDARLEAGELLFLYTDGLTEARRGAELYGEERLLALLGSTTRGPARELVAEVMADVMSFAAGHLRDDLAILAVRLQPTDAQAGERESNSAGRDVSERCTGHD